MHQLRLGNRVVILDLLAFLEGQTRLLRAHDPDKLMATTEALIVRIRDLLGHEP
jgi:hypothetical protein